MCTAGGGGARGLAATACACSAAAAAATRSASAAAARAAGSAAARRAAASRSGAGATAAASITASSGAGGAAKRCVRERVRALWRRHSKKCTEAAQTLAQHYPRAERTDSSDSWRATAFRSASAKASGITISALLSSAPSAALAPAREVAPNSSCKARCGTLRRAPATRQVTASPRAAPCGASARRGCAGGGAACVRLGDTAACDGRADSSALMQRAMLLWSGTRAKSGTRHVSAAPRARCRDPHAVPKGCRARFISRGKGLAHAHPQPRSRGASPCSRSAMRAQPPPRVPHAPPERDQRM